MHRAGHSRSKHAQSWPQQKQTCTELATAEANMLATELATAEANMHSRTPAAGMAYLQVEIVGYRIPRKA
jgi:hypothetical protein